MLQFSSAVPVLRVADVARSVAWYQSILGFRATLVPSVAPHDTCHLRRDQVELMLRKTTGTPALRIPTHQGWDVLIRLSGQALIALLDEARRRTPLVRGPEITADGIVEFELEDPDGHRVCIAEQLLETRGIPRAVG